MAGHCLARRSRAWRNVTGQGRAGGRTVDEEAINKVLATYVETWNQHDMKAWGKLFTDDVDYVNRAGGWWKGNKENVEGHESIHDTLRKQKTTYKATVAKISFLQPDIAIAHATWEMTGYTRPWGENVENFKGIITMVMVKQDGKWLIRAVQNTVTMPKKPVKDK